MGVLVILGLAILAIGALSQSSSEREDTLPDRETGEVTDTNLGGIGEPPGGAPEGGAESSGEGITRIDAVDGGLVAGGEFSIRSAQNRPTVADTSKASKPLAPHPAHKGGAATVVPKRAATLADYGRDDLIPPELLPDPSDRAGWDELAKSNTAVNSAVTLWNWNAPPLLEMTRSVPQASVPRWHNLSEQTQMAILSAIAERLALTQAGQKWPERLSERNVVLDIWDNMAPGAVIDLASPWSGSGFST